MKQIISFIFGVLITIASCSPPQYSAANTGKTASPTLLNTGFDWQGHRGCRGLLPENSIPAFLYAFELGVTTLELDLVVSRDSQLIVSHEAWMNADICGKIGGAEVSKEEAESLLIWHMTKAEVQSYDCGSRGNPRFKTQKAMQTVKPTLAEVVNAVRERAAFLHKPMPFFNIEIKSQPDFDEIRTPSVKTFAQLVFEEIKHLNIKKLACVQSFDPRALKAIHALDKQLTTAFLIENTDGLRGNLGKLPFKPRIYSPYFALMSKSTVDSCHAKGIKIIPWTVNDTTDMRRLIGLGVDGIITDYPDRMLNKL